MTKVLIRHKDGSLSGPFSMEGDYVLLKREPIGTEAQLGMLIDKPSLNLLGLEVIPYEERKVEVTKAMLAQLWKEYKLGAWKGDTDTSVFKRFCEDLGL